MNLKCFPLCSGCNQAYFTRLLSVSMCVCCWFGISCWAVCVLVYFSWLLVFIFFIFCQCVPFNWDCTTQRTNFECNQQIITLYCRMFTFNSVDFYWPHYPTLLSLSCTHFFLSRMSHSEGVVYSVLYWCVCSCQFEFIHFCCCYLISVFSILLSDWLYICVCLYARTMLFFSSVSFRPSKILWKFQISAADIYLYILFFQFKFLEMYTSLALFHSLSLPSSFYIFIIYIYTIQIDWIKIQNDIKCIAIYKYMKVCLHIHTTNNERQNNNKTGKKIMQRKILKKKRQM